MYKEALENFLGRPLTTEEDWLMAMEMEFQAGGLTDEIIAVAGHLSEAIAERKNQLKAMSSREQYKHEEAIGGMLNAMEGFYLFGGSLFVEQKGVRATHPWGAVLYPIYGVFSELSDIHSPLMARKMYEKHVGNLHEAAADARWSKLDSAKKLAFAKREEMPGVSRAEAIRRMLPEVLEAARKAGAPLTGQDPKETITRWFREAGIS